MAKIRKTASIENGVMQVLKILTEEEIQAVAYYVFTNTNE